MEELINFFINVGKLKRKERRGWRVHQIKEAESTASHIFRMAVLSWFLAEQKKLNLEKIIKMALSHDICEVFAPDRTPYDPLLPKEVDSPGSQKKIKEILEEWPSFSLREKKEKEELKFKEEREGFLKLISNLSPSLKKELEKLWLDFVRSSSEEGRFVRQADKAENFLQGLEYWKKHGRIQKNLWIRWAKEVFDDPLFIEFEEAVERRLLEGKSSRSKIDKILDFLIELGKLKSTPRKGWLLIEVEQPGTIADHSFRVAVMAWILGEKRKANLNLEKILKLALIHDFCEVYAEDRTPYYEKLTVNKEKWPELFDRWPRSSKPEKKRRILKKHRIEINSLKQLTSKLPQDLGKEVIDLQLDYIKGVSREARFVKQINRAETLLQALEYAERDQCRPFRSWWVGSKELIDDPLLLEFLKELDEKFHHLESFPKRSLEK